MKQKSAIYQEMRDAEFVLRYFTFMDNWNVFSGGMKRAMDHYMADNQHIDEEAVSKLRQNFLSTIDRVEAAFGNFAYRRYEPKKNAWRNQVLAALYDAQMFAVQEFATEQLAKQQGRILTSFKKLFSQDEFRRSIDAATNTPVLFKHRISSVIEMLKKIIR